MPDLLIELFSEEIPARMQTRASEDLKKLVTDGLVEAGLTYAGAHALSTPRRLTLAIDGLLAQSPDTKEERKGPKVGAPDKAIEGFLRGAGLTRDQLVERDTPKGAIYFALIEKKGRPAADIIAEVLENTIRNFPWPKSMRWGSGNLKWVRPLHSILCILSDEAGSEIVPLDVDGITSGNSTEGHRFMGTGRFSVTSFDDYEAKLKANKVVLNPQDRADHIWEDAKNAAFAQGLEIVEDMGLLKEVAGLVEWPVVLMGDIADDFIALPPEVLQTSMREHQKFFSVRNPKTDRIEKFVTVANRETADNGVTILAGNQKVLFARLADAKFFWENDLRVAEAGAQPWLDSLENVTFHNKLGTQAARIERIAAIASWLAPIADVDPELARKAALWCKADLSSEMVYEFPELQGLMGKYYATAAGHPVEVGAAALEHYSPLGPNDAVPSEPISVLVSLAEKFDLLAAFWAISEKPTGSKDPFALRRAALGVIRILLENKISGGILPIVYWCVAKIKSERFMEDRKDEFVTLAVNLAKLNKDEVTLAVADALRENVGNGQDLDRPKEIAHEAMVIAENLLSFFHDRLKVYLKDQGIRHDVIDACLAMPKNDDLTLLVNRATALAAFLKTDDGENLLQGFKRANNILAQAEEKDGVEYSYGADVKFAEDDTEKALFAALDTAETALKPAMETEDFAAAMTAMASLRAPIDAFFEAVQINSDNEIIRRNRLNLLSRIRQICLSVADLNKVEG